MSKEDDETKELFKLAVKCIDGLADQQAYGDFWWVEAMNRLADKAGVKKI